MELFFVVYLVATLCNNFRICISKGMEFQKSVSYISRSCCWILLNIYSAFIVVLQINPTFAVVLVVYILTYYISDVR